MLNADTYDVRAEEFLRARWNPLRLPMLIKRLEFLQENEEMQEEKETIYGEGEIDFDIEEPHVLQMLLEATEKVMDNMSPAERSAMLSNVRAATRARRLEHLNPSPAAPAVTLIPPTTRVNFREPLKKPVAAEPVPPHERIVQDEKKEKPFACPACGHAFSQKHGLYRHANVHKGNRFKCPVQDCEYAAFEKRHIQKHMKAKHKINI